MKLNDKHRLFVEAYVGDPVQAMRFAGYSGTDPYLKARGEELLETPQVQEALRQRGQYLAKTGQAIAGKEEIQLWWTNIMRNEDESMRPELDSNGITKSDTNVPWPIRIKASENLAKSQSMFVEHLKIDQQVTITDLVSQAYQKVNDEDIDAIEAEYERIRKKEQIEAAPQAADFVPLAIESTPPVPAHPPEPQNATEAKFRLEDWI